MKRNAYTCQSCKKTIVTVDRDEGTTPFMIGCRADLPCGGYMESHFYRIDDVEGDPLFEWRKPTPAEYKKASRAMKDHFDTGGLDLYPFEGVWQ